MAGAGYGQRYVIPMIKLLLLFLGVSSFAVSAEEKPEEEIFSPPVAVYGLAQNATCGDFVRSLESPVKALYFQFMAGFFTGQNLANPTGGSVLGESNLNDAMLWYEKFCRENPMKIFGAGLYMLQLELQKQK